MTLVQFVWYLYRCLKFVGHAGDGPACLYYNKRDGEHVLSLPILAIKGRHIFLRTSDITVELILHDDEGHEVVIPIKASHNRNKTSISRDGHTMYSRFHAIVPGLGGPVKVRMTFSLVRDFGVDVVAEFVVGPKRAQGQSPPPQDHLPTIVAIRDVQGRDLPLLPGLPPLPSPSSLPSPPPLPSSSPSPAPFQLEQPLQQVLLEPSVLGEPEVAETLQELGSMPQLDFSSGADAFAWLGHHLDQLALADELSDQCQEPLDPQLVEGPDRAVAGIAPVNTDPASPAAGIAAARSPEFHEDSLPQWPASPMAAQPELAATFAAASQRSSYQPSQKRAKYVPLDPIEDDVSNGL